MAQTSLRDFGYLLRNPTLERVGYSQISLREIRVGYSRISPPGDVSRKWLIGDNRTRPENVQTLGTSSGVSSPPDTEMIPLKTTENLFRRSG